jgi:hypothetical protein
MSSTVLAAFEIAFSVGLVGFWSYFFLVENKNPARSAVYLGFERSFPLPDLGWVAPCLVAAAVGVLRDQKFGYILTIAGGGALIFLGLVDISFNIRNRQYTSNLADGIMNAFINTACMAFGPLFIVVGARYLS